MNLRLAAAAAALALAAVAVTGCSTPAGAPKPTPAFSSEAEAFAAAEATYRAYVDALNAVDLSDPSTFEDVYSWTTGDANAGARRVVFADARRRVDRGGPDGRLRSLTLAGPISIG